MDCSKENVVQIKKKSGEITLFGNCMYNKVKNDVFIIIMDLNRQMHFIHFFTADLYGGSFIKVKYTEQGRPGYFCEVS